VGQAFDLYAGRVGQAPRWTRDNGLECFSLNQQSSAFVAAVPYLGKNIPASHPPQTPAASSKSPYRKCPGGKHLGPPPCPAPAQSIGH
jgi:hypothetical protein